MVDIVGNIIIAILFGWPVAATATDFFLNQPRPTEGESMRVAHAGSRFGSIDDPHFRSDLRGGLDVVLRVDSEAVERAARQARSKARSAVYAIPRNRHEGPLTRLRGMLSMFRRCDALEDKMDGLAAWLGECK